MIVSGATGVLPWSQRAPGQGPATLQDPRFGGSSRGSCRVRWGSPGRDQEASAAESGVLGWGQQPPLALPKSEKHEPQGSSIGSLPGVSRGAGQTHQIGLSARNGLVASGATMSSVKTIHDVTIGSDELTKSEHQRLLRLLFDSPAGGGETGRPIRARGNTRGRGDGRASDGSGHQAATGHARPGSVGGNVA